MKMGIAILSLLIETLFACNPQAINIQTGDVSVQQSLGIRGPLLITDIQVIDHNEFENKIIINPPVELKFQWDKSNLLIFPQISFNPNTSYTLSIPSSLKLTNSSDFSDQTNTISFTTHFPCLSYIGQADKSPEIMKICLDNSPEKTLTQTNGKVYDFNVSYDGNWIFYSIQNEKGGIDIWRIDLEGKNNQVLIDCGSDHCSNSIGSVDGEEIAYLKSTYKNNSFGSSSEQQIWILNLIDHVQRRIFSDKDIYTENLTWSPDGIHLSFYEEKSSSIWIWDRNTGNTEQIKTGANLGYSWNDLGNEIVYGELDQWGGLPFFNLLQWDNNTNSSNLLFNGEEQLVEFNNPQWRPQMDWIATAIRPLSGSSSKQIVLLSLNSSNQIIVTNAQKYTYSAFSWDPSGEDLLFQRYELGTSSAQPEIGVWNINDRSEIILAENATLPKWIP